MRTVGSGRDLPFPQMMSNVGNRLQACRDNCKRSLLRMWLYAAMDNDCIATIALYLPIPASGSSSPELSCFTYPCRCQHVLLGMSWVDIFAGSHKAPEFKNALLRHLAGFGRRRFRLRAMTFISANRFCVSEILARG